MSLLPENWWTMIADAQGAGDFTRPLLSFLGALFFILR
jgi:hypothetical protein